MPNVYDTADPKKGKQLPTCPVCAATLLYPQINVAKEFDCLSCGNKLAVSEDYTKACRTASYMLTLAICLVLAFRNLYLLLLAPAILFVVGMITSIASKRIFPPPIEDVVARSKAAKYIAL